MLNFIDDFLSIHLVPVTMLKPHEKFCTENLNFWLEQIAMKQYWTHPLLVHKETKIIMDGHHRHQIGQKLGLKYIPCILTSYKNPYVKVYSYKDNSILDEELIIQAGESGKLFDKKSTRHEIAFNYIPQVNIPLALLQ